VDLSKHFGSVSYTIKVLAKETAPKTYLFGSQTVFHSFEAKYPLVIRVPTDGETIKIKAQGYGDPFDICTLHRGQVFGLLVANLKAVWADQPASDTHVHCTLIPSGFF
jgi:hypothetical protein